jgi:hypothetical protein
VARTLVITISAVALLAFGAMTAAATTTTTHRPRAAPTSRPTGRRTAPRPAFTTLAPSSSAEAANNDFKTSGTLVLTAPSGWQFNPAAAVSATPGKVGGGSTAIDISASVGAITASTITINITVNATARLDNLTLSGIQVQAVEGGTLPGSGNMLRTSANPGTATIVGVSNDVTNFGSLSQAVGALRLFVVLPGQSLTDGATVASSGIAGAAPNQAAGVAFNLVELVAADRQFNVDATYSGAKTVAWSGPGGSPNYTTNVSFTSGHSTTTLATTLRKAELVALSATSATSPAIATGQPSASFAVDPGPAAKLQILLPGETAAPGTASGKTGAPSAQTSASPSSTTCASTPVDADWNMISSAAPDVAIGSFRRRGRDRRRQRRRRRQPVARRRLGHPVELHLLDRRQPQTLSATDVAAALGAGTSASVTVNKPASATGLVSSQNPAVFGQSVTFTATVAGANGTPTGTVDFKDGASVIASALPLDGSGVASFSTSSPDGASHTISAVYRWQRALRGEHLRESFQVVSKAGTATALVSSLNPACAGQAVTLTATVTVVAPGAGVPAGTVSFKDGSTVIGGSIALNASGVATFTTSALASGNRNLTAVYNGNANFSTSTSAPALVQAVMAKPRPPSPAQRRSAPAAPPRSRPRSAARAPGP